MVSKQNRRAGVRRTSAKAKRISFSIPAAAVARLESLAKACDIRMDAVWRLIRKEAAHAVTEKEGTWLPSASFAAAWDHGTRANAARVAKRLSLLDRGLLIDIRFGNEEITYQNGVPVKRVPSQYRLPAIL